MARSRQGQFPVRREAGSGRFGRMHGRQEESPFDLRHVADPDTAQLITAGAVDNVLCAACGWHGERAGLLSSPNPFRDGMIYACPVCRQIETVAVRCSHRGCLAPATCSTPADHHLGEGVLVCSSHRYPESSALPADQ